MTTSASRHNEKYHSLRNNNNFRNEGILESWATASNVVLGHGRPWLDQQIPIFLVVDILFVGGDGWCWWLKIDTVKSNKRCTLWYFQPINNHDSVYLFVDGFASEILGDLWEIFPEQRIRADSYQLDVRMPGSVQRLHERPRKKKDGRWIGLSANLLLQENIWNYIQATLQPIQWDRTMESLVTS